MVQMVVPESLEDIGQVPDGRVQGRNIMIRLSRGETFQVRNDHTQVRRRDTTNEDQVPYYEIRDV